MMTQLAEREVVRWAKPFRELCCEKLKISQADYEQKVFWHCLHLHCLPIAYLIFRKNPAFFKEDFDFIHEVGVVNDAQTFKTELNRFHGRNVRDKSWLRGVFSVRVSAKRLIKLKNQVLNLGRYALE